MSCWNVRKLRGNWYKTWMSCQCLVKGPDAAGNLIVLITQLQPHECHDMWKHLPTPINQGIMPNKLKMLEWNVTLSDHLYHPIYIRIILSRVSSTWPPLTKLMLLLLLMVAQTVENLPAMQETQVPFLGWEDPLKKGKATHSSILAWRIPWTEEPGGPQSLRSKGVRHNWATYTLFLFTAANDSRQTTIVLKIF